MPGLFTITNRLNGIFLTDTIYNGDRQDIVDHMEPSYIDTPSGSAGAMQTTSNPGEVGTEALAPTLLVYLQQIAFCLKEMKGTAQWYVSEVAKSRTLPFTWYPAATGNNWPKTADSTLQTVFKVPYDYSSGNLVIRIIRAIPSGSGGVVMTASSVRHRNSAAPATLDTGTAFNFTNLDTLSHQADYTISSSFALGDYIIVNFTRTVADVSDTLAGPLTFGGLSLEYTGYASR